MFYVFIFKIFVWLCCTACEVLVPLPGIEPVLPPVVETQSYWTTRKSHSILNPSLDHRSLSAGMMTHLNLYNNKNNNNYNNSKHLWSAYSEYCCVLSCFSHIQLFVTIWTVAYQAPWDSPGKNTRVGYHFLLQRIFPTHGLNSHLLHRLYWQEGSLPLVQPGKLLQWVRPI